MIATENQQPSSYRIPPAEKVSMGLKVGILALSVAAPILGLLALHVALLVICSLDLMLIGKKLVGGEEGGFREALKSFGKKHKVFMILTGVELLATLASFLAVMPGVENHMTETLAVGHDPVELVGLIMAVLAFVAFAMVIGSHMEMARASSMAAASVSRAADGTVDLQMRESAPAFVQVDPHKQDDFVGTDTARAYSSEQLDSERPRASILPDLAELRQALRSVGPGDAAETISHASPTAAPSARIS